MSTQLAPGPSSDLPPEMVKRAIDLISRGLDESHVYYRLAGDGVEPDLAWAVALAGWDEYCGQRRGSALNKMAIGALWLVAGMLVTTLCYSAPALGYSAYLLAYTPMAVGIVIILRGFVEIPPQQSSRSRRLRVGRAGPVGFSAH